MYVSTSATASHSTMRRALRIPTVRCDPHRGSQNGDGLTANVTKVRGTTHGS